MIHLFINALSASAGGGLTYVRNVMPRMAARNDVRTTLVAGQGLRGEIVESNSVTVLTDPCPEGSARRFGYEQLHVPHLIRRSQADVLLSTGNVALFRSPVPQILLSRNALYLSAHFLRDVRERGDYRLFMDTAVKGALARWSVHAAECTVAPSETFAAELQQWAGKPVACIHHGFDRNSFCNPASALPPDVEGRLAADMGSLRILFVSHYNYYRNFETLIRAVAILKEALHPRRVRLLLTCKLATGQNPGTYQADSAAHLIRRLHVEDEVVELGAVPYGALHHLYRAADIYVTPAYAETFAHPLVEAMASGLPVIASDLAVHREICGDAARYFPCFSPEDLAVLIRHVDESADLQSAMRTKGLVRSRDFSWDMHVDKLVQLAHRVAVHP